MTQALITSATGKVGRHIPDFAQPLGVQCRRFARRLAPHADTVVGSLDSDDDLQRALDGCEQLFFCVPFSERMTQQAQRLLGHARYAGIQHIVRLSGWRAGELPDNQMAVLHGQIDEAVRNSGINYTLLRCNSFWQNLTELYWPLLEKTGILSLPEADAPQAFIDTRQIAWQAAEILADPKPWQGQTLDLHGPETLTFSQALQRLNQQHGTRFRYQQISAERASRRYRNFGLTDREISTLLSLADSISQGDMDPTQSTKTIKKPLQPGS